LLPASGAGRDLRSLEEHLELRTLLAKFDGVFFPGSVSNVDPAVYGAGLEFSSEYLDKQRDALTLALIRVAVEEGVPLLAVCRGLHEMNVAYGGTLHQSVYAQPGLLDHREDTALQREQQYAPAHPVELTAGGWLADLLGRESIEVNSLHNQGIAKLGSGLTVEATAPDGLIEAIRVTDASSFAVAIQWHAEWRFWEDEVSASLFSAFGDAARSRAAARI
ncbi:MAG: gamma-glutamyl-gamma-aminobutyrate hydrolase family protein, partial [Gammaproteobacteria bacterium]|nr:gamma-glutamyl-gamma-aminobutyrate hydrolase family protein [Gammaproteobacteria bacterium]